jgi:diacylglycerol kinase family enzyme
MVVFLNPGSNYGTGQARWDKVKDALLSRCGSFQTIVTASPDELRQKVTETLRGGDRMLIAAGGDGTVNLLLNAVIAATDDPDIMIGGIGLGSSNDFHKPFRPEACVGPIPIRVDAGRSFPCDVIRIDYLDALGGHQRHYCLLNASIGVTAQANAFFNSRTSYIRLIQRLSTDLAVAAAALRTMMTFRNIPCRVRVDSNVEEQFAVTNLGVVKNPHFAGSFCYDTAIAPDDGFVGVNLCYGLSLPGMLAMLAALQRHEFSGRPKTRCWRASSLSVSSDSAFALEMDGEVVQTRSAEFSVVPRRVRCCR